jgi:hypothetical protein
MNNIKSLISDIAFNNFFEILTCFCDNCSSELFKKLSSEFEDQVFISLYHDNFNFKEI